MTLKPPIADDTILGSPPRRPSTAYKRRKKGRKFISSKQAIKLLPCVVFRDHCICGGCDKVPFDLRYHDQLDLIRVFLFSVRYQVDQEIVPQVLDKAGTIAHNIRDGRNVETCDELEVDIRHLVFHKYFHDMATNVLDILQARVQLSLGKIETKNKERTLSYRLQSLFNSFGKKKTSQSKVDDKIPRSQSETYILNKLAVNLEVFDRLDMIDMMKKANKTDTDCLKYLYWLLMYKRRDFFFPDPPPYVDPRCSAETPRPSHENNLGA